MFLWELYNIALVVNAYTNRDIIYYDSMREKIFFGSLIFAELSPYFILIQSSTIF
jgi:hypothetical protein